MKTRGVRCWKAAGRCDNGHTVEVYFTVPDFGDSDKLFTCLACAAIYVVNPDAEYYSGVPFEQLRQTTSCEVCGRTLMELAQYPETFLCIHDRELGHFFRNDRTIPPSDDALVKDFWDPYS